MKEERGPLGQTAEHMLDKPENKVIEVAKRREDTGREVTIKRKRGGKC